jgi:diguanylate cyclase (GGDEF)-like protein
MYSNTQTILIVDDMPSNIEILDEILSSQYDILFATSGQEALDIALQERPDLILLDIIMPEMDGYTVHARLKDSDETRDIPVIFVTGMDQDEDESKGLNAGVIDYITKPLRPHIVKARVRNHLELKRYRDHLKTLSAIDGLTGIANRRQFDETLEKEWRRGRRNQAPLSLLMLDIDLFKAFNDHYGHLAGDECLQKVANGLTEIIKRPADLLARFGGEEFVIVLPETDSPGASKVAGLALEKVQRLNIPHAYSNVTPRITVSIGVATLIPDELHIPLDLIRSADDLLYEAKRNGRNQIKTTIDMAVK